MRSSRAKTRCSVSSPRPEWQQCTIKTLRLRLLNIGAVVVRHARELQLKVPADHPYWQLLAHSRDKILRLAPQ